MTKTDALRLCVKEIEQFHATAYPGCTGGCPAHEAMDAANKILRHEDQQMTEVKDLKLADVVESFDGAFGTAIVVKIEGDNVHLFRPYGTTGDFSHTGGVTPYVGFESYSIDQTSKHLWRVLCRKDLK